MQLPEPTEAKNWEGASVVDRDGEHLGRCTGVYADVDTGATEWLTVDVQGHRSSFIPALDATEDDGTVRVRFPRSDVLSAPQVGDDQELSKGDEVRLYEHYRVEHTSAASGSVLPTAAPADESAPRGGDSPSGVDSPTVAIPAPDPLTSTLAGSPLPSSTESVGTPADELDAAERAADDLALPVVAAPPVIAAAPPLPKEPVSVEPPLEPEPEPLVVAAPQLVTPPVEASTPAPLAAPRPQPQPSSTASSSALAPIAVVAGVIAVASVALRAWELRSRRRQRPAARAARASKQLKLGSAAALRNAGQQLTAVPEVASRTAQQLASAAAAASDTAAAKGSAVSQSVASKSSAVTHSVAALPPAVAKRGRRARRSAAGTLWDVAAVGTAGTGYVLGSKAGHERYEQITQQASELASSPQVQALTDAVSDRLPGSRT